MTEAILETKENERLYLHHLLQGDMLGICITSDTPMQT